MPEDTRAKPLFAGLDVSTQSCKAVVIDPERGEVSHVDRIEYDRDLPHYGTEEGAVAGLGKGVSESDPRMWLEAVEILLGRLGEAGVAADRVHCVSVSGQQHGLVALAADDTLARSRAKLWNDFSTAEECRILTEAVGGAEAMIAEVGNTQRTGYTAPKVLHLRRHEPQLYDRTRTLLIVHNYINWHLTGGPDGGVAVMEPGDTSGTALWHPGKKTWSRKVLDAIDPELLQKLPPIGPADRTIGNIGATLAARFGLPPDCRVDAGCGDNMYGAVGTGNFEPGMITVSLGTSGTACTVLDEPFIDPTGEIAAYCDSTGRYLPLLCVSNMANGYNAVLERYGLSHEEFDVIVKRTPPASVRPTCRWRRRSTSASASRISCPRYSAGRCSRGTCSTCTRASRACRSSRARSASPAASPVRRLGAGRSPTSSKPRPSPCTVRGRLLGRRSMRPGSGTGKRVGSERSRSWPSLSFCWTRHVASGRTPSAGRSTEP